jgi:hypothetical protein
LIKAASEKYACRLDVLLIYLPSIGVTAVKGVSAIFSFVN